MPWPVLLMLPSVDAKRAVSRRFQTQLRARGITPNHNKMQAQQALCRRQLPCVLYLRSMQKTAPRLSKVA